MGNKVYFQALDSKGDNALWVSDGTAAGTSEIGGGGNSSVAGAPTTGLTPNNLTGFGDDAMFYCLDSNLKEALWITDGTVAGTKEVGEDDTSLLGGLLGSAVFADTALIGHQILFEGFDPTYDLPSLWVTDGTTAGTVEVGGAGNHGVSGVSTTIPILVQSGITSIGSKALFVTMDSGGASTLWASDGSAAGTTEIGGLNNAGVANAPTTGLNPSLTGIYSLGKRAVFANKDSSGDWGLWSTDGTAAGTFEVGGLSNGMLGSGAGNLGLALENSETAAYSGVMFFEDASGDLWETNGTLAGTWDIGKPTGTISHTTSFIGGAIFESTSGGLLGIGATQGLFSTNGVINNFTEVGGANNAGVSGAPITGLNIITSVSFGNDVIFTALDSQLAVGLWITNGTAAGTIEIGGLKDAGVAGASTLLGLSATNLTVSGGQVFFSGLDNTGHYGLWSTDGTTAGTQELSTTANALLGLVSTEVQNVVNAMPVGDVYSGGGQTITDLSEFTNYSYFDNTGSNWATANTNNDVFGLDNASLSVIGGANVVNFSIGKNATSLYQTGGQWDTVNGSNGAVTVNGAQASILGGGNYVYGSGGSWMSLYQTNGSWDTVTGTAENLILNATQSSIVGGGNNINATDFSTMSLYQTNGNWDGVNGSRDNIILQGAQAAISGGSNNITQSGGSSISLFQTVSEWDSVTGSGGTVILNQAQSSIAGGSNTIYQNGVCSISLYNTGGNWDVVYGSNDNVTLNSSQATIIGDNNFVFVQGSNTFSLSGSNDRVVTSAALGQDFITGFNSTDSMQFAATDFASFSALQNHMAQSGVNTIITLDGSNSIELFGVTATSLKSSQFSFV